MTIEISDVEKGLYHAWSDYEYKEGNLYSTTFRDGWLMGIEWYKKKLEDIRNSSTASADGVFVDLNTCRASYKDITVILPRREALLLHFIMTNKHRFFTREEILNEVWPDDVIVGPRTIDVHMCKVKKRLNLTNLLINIKGVGLIWKR